MWPLMNLLIQFLIVILLSCIGFELLKIRRMLESGQHTSDTKS